ncbi:hypothetical protein AGOR_G00100690 [Albula goreensis]|uniref:Scaffolding anchor of CK1 domain-containing protein n=1 Tax=Albula goreensis TaxID=1534307 RepID=A0A8T3DHK8_9TELE|nr:hypothetical protein AGOR_G00100690 [Albula goreensis]
MQRWPLSRTQNSSEMYQSPTPLDCRLSEVSSQWGEHDSEDYVHPHYKEEYRLAIYALVSGGREAYDNFLKSEQMGNFLSEQELRYILQNVKQMRFDLTEENSGIMSDTCSSDTYWPVESDLETPDLELGWPQGTPDVMGTDINLFFHPPRQNCPTIKEVIRKLIQAARQVIAIVMDVFTDVDIFKEIVEASLMGVAVYILLDDFHLTSFLSMAEQHDVHIQRLKKMRVRAVKGQEYLCRSGAMFHGTMEQKFMLVDCKTVVYGSYSFMWSYEKLHLSMVQVITGQLVRAFDEEFRVLFARSTVPDVLSEKCFQSLHSRHSQGACMASAFYIPHPSERRDQPAQILDRVYKRACGIQPSSNTCVLETEVKLRNKGPVDKTPTINHSETMQNQLYPLQGAATSSFLKRRSYGGGMRESTCIPDQLSKMNSVGNWNIVRDGGLHDSTGRSDYSCSPPQSVRLQNLYKKDRMKRQSYHGMDKELLSLRQNLPTWDNTSKSFLRLWRVESYLSNTDPHKADSSDTLSNGLHCRPNPYLPSRLRSSLVFKATIPEHPESHTNATDSTSTGLQDDECSSSTSRPLYSPTLQYPVKHTHRSERQDHTLKRHSFHTLDKPTSRTLRGVILVPSTGKSL